MATSTRTNGKANGNGNGTVAITPEMLAAALLANPELADQAKQINRNRTVARGERIEVPFVGKALKGEKLRYEYRDDRIYVSIYVFPNTVDELGARNAFPITVG